jgi:hypothetical protein
MVTGAARGIGASWGKVVEGLLPGVAGCRQPSGVHALAGQQSLPLRLKHLAVRVMPGSGEPAELLAAAEIDAVSIEKAARQLLNGNDGQGASTPAPPG